MPHIGVDELLNISAGRDEPTRLTALRRRGLAHYTTADLPDRVQHLWRYTDPFDLVPSDAFLAARSVNAGQQLEAPELGASAFLTSGQTIGVTCTEAATTAGITLRPLRHAGDDLALMGQAVRPSHGLLEALNTASWSTGVWVGIPPGVHIEGTLDLVIDASAGATTLPRVLVTVGAGAEVTVVERHSGGGRGAHVIGVSELFVGPGASVRYVIAQDWDKSVVGHLTERAEVARDAQLVTVLSSFGGRVVKMDIGADLRGERARSELAGVVLGDGRQHFDHHTVHRHCAPQTWSNIDLRVALTGRSRSAYTGLIRIEECASKSEAYQEERNLLFGTRCRADAIPELEILNNDVQCTHGATTSPVDEEQLFYLRSRGIEAAEARKIVVRGFLDATLRRLPPELLKLLEPQIHTKLAALSGA